LGWAPEGAAASPIELARRRLTVKVRGPNGNSLQRRARAAYIFVVHACDSRPTRRVMRLVTGRRSVIDCAKDGFR
jgi:hypothetical protein